MKAKFHFYIEIIFSIEIFIQLYAIGNMNF